MHPESSRFKPLTKAIAVVIAVVILAVLWTPIKTYLFGVEEFRPHASCYLYDQNLIWLVRSIA